MEISIQIEIKGDCRPGIVHTVAAKVRDQREILKVVYLRDKNGNCNLLALCDPDADIDVTLENIRRLPQVARVKRCKVL